MKRNHRWFPYGSGVLASAVAATATAVVLLISLRPDGTLPPEASTSVRVPSEELEERSGYPRELLIPDGEVRPVSLNFAPPPLTPSAETSGSVEPEFDLAPTVSDDAAGPSTSVVVPRGRKSLSTDPRRWLLPPVLECELATDGRESAAVEEHAMPSLEVLSLEELSLDDHLVRAPEPAFAVDEPALAEPDVRGPDVRGPPHPLPPAVASRALVEAAARSSTQPRPAEPDVVVRAEQGDELRGVIHRAHQLNEQAFSLAQRGAHYSARAKFIQALRLVAQALDGREDTSRHSQALANGLRAMKEGDDFMPAGSQLEANLDMKTIIAGHRTPVLQDEVVRDERKGPPPLAALQQYYTYAQQELAEAGGKLAVASRALYGLGKLHMVMGAEPGAAQRMSGPKAMTLHQAALRIQPSNFRAANELGVLLARFGQYDEARQMLVQSVSVYPMPETWNNLAVVHERLQQFELAQRARQEFQLAVEMHRQQTGGVGGVPHPSVRWIAPEQFAKTNRLAPLATQPGSTSSAPPPTEASNPDSSDTAWSFWPWKNSSR